MIGLLPTLNYSEIKDLCATHTNFRDMCKKPIVKKMINDIEKRDSMTNTELKNAVREYLQGGEREKAIVEKYGEIGEWNVSSVTDMSLMFGKTSPLETSETTTIGPDDTGKVSVLDIWVVTTLISDCEEDSLCESFFKTGSSSATPIIELDFKVYEKPPILCKLSCKLSNSKPT